MEIGASEQEAIDFDWFGVDEEGLVGHFTSAGFKSLPKSVSGDAHALALITEYFRSSAPIKGSHHVDDAITNARPDWKGEDNERRYLRSFVSMADRGLFSFDIDTYVEPGLEYFRVACPENPATLDEFPGEVREIVSRTVLRGVRLRSQSRVLYEATLSM